MILKAMELNEIIQIKTTERKRQRLCPTASHLSKVKKKEKANKKNWEGVASNERVNQESKSKPGK